MRTTATQCAEDKGLRRRDEEGQARDMVDAQGQIAKLQEQLTLCQRELAQARRQQEEAAESSTADTLAQQKLTELAAGLNKRLTAGENVTGPRGAFKRRIMSTMPRSHEDADLAVLRSSRLMNGTWYLSQYPEVAAAGISPALHYLRHGARDNLNPGPSFNTRKYRSKNPGLPKDVNPLVHFHASHPGTTA